MFSTIFSWKLSKVDPLLHYFQLYSKYFDYFDQLLPKFNNIFALTPLMHAFYWVFNIQFSQFSIWAWYYSLTRFKHFWPIWVFPKNGIINFSLCQKHHFDKTWICFYLRYLNTCPSIHNVPMAISFKVFILGISVFSKTCWKLNSTAI